MSDEHSVDGDDTGSFLRSLVDITSENSRRINKVLEGQEVAKGDRAQIIEVQRAHSGKINSLETGQRLMQQHIDDKIDNGLTTAVANAHEEVSILRKESRKDIHALSNRLWGFAVTLGASGAVLGAVTLVVLRVLKVVP